jgi:hypothetical protein
MNLEGAKSPQLVTNVLSLEWNVSPCLNTLFHGHASVGAGALFHAAGERTLQ